MRGQCGGPVSKTENPHLGARGRGITGRSAKGITPRSLCSIAQIGRSRGLEMSLPHEELRRLLHYDPETGIWTWLSGWSRKANHRIGKRAGCIHKKKWGNRRLIVVKGKAYLSSRLAWFYMTGKWPDLYLDHKNRITIDDSWKNLRLATGEQNNANAKIRSHNRVGLKGVQKHRLRWRALIGSGKSRVVIGSFDCPAAAHFAYVIEADKRYGEFACAR